MRAYLLALAAIATLTACGSDTGILISVTADESVPAQVEELHFIIGVQDPSDQVLVRDDFSAEVFADVTDRDLTSEAYKLLLKDAGEGPDPTTVVVGVVGLSGGTEIAFAGMTSPATFMPGQTIEYGLILSASTAGTDYDSTGTGCFSWDSVAIVSPDDRDCDGCDDVTNDGCADECTDASECETAYGPSPCGEWQCNLGACEVLCDDCTDADFDGYGVGDGCAGLDCDDADDTMFEGVSRPCYTGPDSTVEIGTCQAGTETCLGGSFTSCSGEVTPSGEACNGEDDDCDGTDDEDLGTITCGIGACMNTIPACNAGTPNDPTSCTPGVAAIDDSTCDGIDNDCDGAIDEDCPCVLVAPGGNDGTGDTVNAFATIQAAITYAAGDADRPKVVCLSAGATCTGSHTFTGPVTMANGIQVQGRYESTGRTRCTPAQMTTTINTGTGAGVIFPSAVQSPTGLDGVTLQRFATPTTSAVSIDGAKNAVLSDVRILLGPDVTNSYGVNVLNEGEVLITGSSIDGSNGTAESIGVRSIEGKVTIRDNCGGYTGGRCSTWCFNGPEPAIRGRMGTGVGTVYAVYLENSPGSVIERSAVCGTNGDSGAAIKITGEAAGIVIRHNLVAATAATVEADAIHAVDCEGDAPWIVDNHSIESTGRTATTLVHTIHASGDCHPVVDSNLEIIGGGEGGTAGTVGVLCDATSKGPSRCVVVNNPKIQGSFGLFPPTATGVRCEGGACMRIQGNNITGFSAVTPVGVWLGDSPALVDNNVITGGCATTAATGIHADGSSARIQNNRIFAGGCTQGTTAATTTFTGLYSLAQGGATQLDVHSNVIDGAGAETTCDGAGIRLDAGGNVTAGSGLFRNNIILAGECETQANVRELLHVADPGVFENNDLVPDPNTATPPLYIDETSATLSTAADVNMLTDTVSSGNISVDPMFVSYPGDLHLQSGSMCVGAGTPTGAPATDMDGDARDATAPDIGPDER